MGISKEDFMTYFREKNYTAKEALYNIRKSYGKAGYIVSSDYEALIDIVCEDEKYVKKLVNMKSVVTNMYYLIFIYTINTIPIKYVRTFLETANVATEEDKKNIYGYLTLGTGKNINKIKEDRRDLVQSLFLYFKLKF